MLDTYTPTDEQRELVLTIMGYNKLFQTRGTGSPLDHIEVLQPWSQYDSHQLLSARGEYTAAYNKLREQLIADTNDLVRDLRGKFPEAPFEAIVNAIFRTRAYVAAQKFSESEVLKRAYDLEQELQNLTPATFEESVKERDLDNKMTGYLLGEDDEV